MGGGPWSIFNKDASDVFVFSALDEFMITSPVFDKSRSRICHGVMATVEKIPKLFTFRSLLFHGTNGINSVSENRRGFSQAKIMNTNHSFL